MNHDLQFSNKIDLTVDFNWRSWVIGDSIVKEPGSDVRRLARLAEHDCNNYHNILKDQDNFYRSTNHKIHIGVFLIVQYSG